MTSDPAPDTHCEEGATPEAGGVANPAVIDLFGLDPANDQVLLVMHEPRPWDGADAQLHQVQEKFNAYVSFILDGEMLAAHPELEGKLTRIELRCAHYPSARALALLAAIRDQLELQSIAVEVIAPPSPCGQDHCECAAKDNELGSC